MFFLKKTEIKRKCRKALAVAGIVTASMSMLAGLGGCGILRETDATDERTATNDSSKLESGMYYVWHDDKQTNIEADINTDVSKFKEYSYKIFTPVYSESTPVENSKESSLRILWMNASNDNKIPTLYEGDELIYYSNNAIPTTLSIERFYDHGYTIGVYGLEENITGSEQYVLRSSTTNSGLKTGSSAAKLAQLLTEDDSAISFADIGEQPVNAEKISKAGTIKGLLCNSDYKTSVYKGTQRYTVTLTADTRVFSSMESFSSISYDLIGNGVLRVNLPDYLKSGYYYINGVGIFRYVKGTSYDNTTNFNDPVIIKSDDGKTIYNPAKVDEDSRSKNKITYTNTDNINESGVSSVVKKNVSVKDDEKVTLNITLGEAKDVSKKPEIKISYYSADVTDSTASKKDNEIIKGSAANPYTMKLSIEDMENGVITKVIDDIPAGTWTFKIDGLSNYTKHVETVTTSIKRNNTSGSSSSTASK